MIELKTEFPKIATLLDGTYELTFSIKKLNLGEFEALRGKQIKIVASEFHQKRTKTQNSYMWALINELAIKLNLGSAEVYRSFIRDYGVRDYIAIRNESAQRFISDWKDKGLGFFAEDMLESKLDGCTKVAVYYGSSTYDSKEMARLIDGVIQECQIQNIPTLTIKEFLMLENANDEVQMNGK